MLLVLRMFVTIMEIGELRVSYECEEKGLGLPPII
jgi:hypothetical protein